MDSFAEGTSVDGKPVALVHGPTRVGAGGFQRLPAATLAALVASTHDGVLVVDVQGRVLCTNQAMAQLTGHDRWELEGLSLHALVGDDDTKVLALGRAVVDDGGARSCRIDVQRSDGAFVECDAQLHADEVDGRTVIVALLHEAGVRRRYGSTDIDEFDARVHELVNSLAGLRGYVDLLRRAPGDKQPDVLDRLEAIARTTASRLENLLVGLTK